MIESQNRLPFRALWPLAGGGLAGIALRLVYSGQAGETQYSLRESKGQTLLRVRMHYRVSTRFNWYAGPMADLLVGNFAEVVLRFYARRAELAEQSQGSAAS